MQVIASKGDLCDTDRFVLYLLSGIHQPLRGSCGRAIDNLRIARQRFEQKDNFLPSSKKGKKCGKIWNVKMVCLDKTDAEKVPCNKYERSLLAEAGLGEKVIAVPDTSSIDEFKAVIEDAFPKLEGCGGYEILRCVPNSKDLELISPVISQTPRLLRGIIGAGRIFIRPIQQNLSASPVSFSEVHIK